KGFHAYDKQWADGEDIWGKPGTLKFVNDGSVAYLDSFRNYAEDEGIRCYFIFTPISYPAYCNISNYPEYKQVLNKQGIYFTDFNDERYNDSTLFSDHMHLNQKGVDVFMQQLLSDTTLF